MNKLMTVLLFGALLFPSISLAEKGAAEAGETYKVAVSGMT